MVAEFARLVSICGKIRATKCAGKTIYSLAVKLLWMHHPPSSAASIGTEYFLLPAFNDFKLCAALFAVSAVIVSLNSGLSKFISLAI